MCPGRYRAWPPLFMRHLFEPALVNGPFGDPGLYADFRDERRALLVDLPDLAALPPRKLLRVSHVFVSHAHMDHFNGFDRLLRVVLGRKERVTLTGGPGFVAQVEHKLHAYTWNVVQRYDVALTLAVREVRPDGTGAQASFCSRTGFEREADGAFAAEGDVLHDEAVFRVRGRFVDHGVPCLAFAVEEKARVALGRDRIGALGFGTGAWLRALKAAVLSGAPDDAPLDVRWRDRAGDHAATRTVGQLRPLVLAVGPGRRVGYVTDLRYTEANVDALAALLEGVDVLFVESVFLDADVDHATRKHHLTAGQAGAIARRIGAKSVVPFHFSPRYDGRGAEIVAEVEAAWGRTLGRFDSAR